VADLLSRSSTLENDGTMAELSLTRKSARELAQIIRTRAISPVEVLDAHLLAIERYNPKLNAIVTLANEQAQDAAGRRRLRSRRAERSAHCMGYRLQSRMSL